MEYSELISSYKHVSNFQWVWRYGDTPFFTFAPCMLLHLFYLKPTPALFCQIHSHSHLKLQTVKNVCETHN